MVTGKHGARRDEVCSAARALVQEELELFEAAGQQLDAIYSEEMVREDDDFPLGPGERYAAKETPESVRLKRLGVAAKCFRFPESHPYDNHFDFEGIGPIEDRKQAARMGILVMLAAGDPDKGGVITPAMGVLANTPFEIKGKDRLPGIGGSQWLSWNETGWDDYNEPSPRVLKRLREAIDIVRHGSLDAARKSRIPSGDGRPCDQPGLNKYDEADRALRDVKRYVGHFRSSIEQWRIEWPYRFVDERRQELDEIKLLNRPWWQTWSDVLKRAREAVRALELQELTDLKQQALDGLMVIADIYSEPLFYLDHEEPGDHIYRAAHQWGGDQAETDIVSRLSEAINDVEATCRGCRFFLDSPDEPTQHSVSEHASSLKKPMSVDAATKTALAIVKRRGWPKARGKVSIRAMADLVKCSPSTIKKAIGQSPSLRQKYQSAGVGTKSHLDRDSDQLAELISEQARDDRSPYAI